jgi:acetolactate synthase-1/2/3 large subunit
VLNVRQRAFAEHYIALGHQANAAKLAGYSERSAGRTANKLLKNVEVAAYLQELIKTASSKRIAAAEEVLETLTRILRREERDILAWPDDGKLYVAHVLRDLWKTTQGESIVTTDVGQHQMWAAQYYFMEHPYRLITSGGSGTMGFGLPSAIGSWFAHPDQEIWTVVGDGGFQMTQAELSTAVQEGANIKIALMNNNFLGMVRQWQEFFFEKRYSAVQLHNPDFVKVAEAHGVSGMRVTTPEEVLPAINFARRTPGPVLLEFRVEKEEAVYPMVPTGADLDAMIRHPIRRQTVADV